jgi:macrolide transport system ATP-binding/permease protein
MSLVFDRISFTYGGAPTPVFQDLSLHCDRGWTGIVGANGTGKTTLLLLARGTLTPDAGTVCRPGDVVYCQQRTGTLGDDVRAFLEAGDGEAHRLRGLFVVAPAWASRWGALSDGERKRAQVGAALWRTPAVLLLDEPTNHIDAEGRRLLATGLRQYPGVGLLVSHDRELLDDLCRQCVFVEPPVAMARPGGYTDAWRAHQDDERARRRQREDLSSEVSRLRREATRRAGEARQADRRRSKRGLARGDSDGRARVDLARMSGADGRAGALARQMASRVARAERQLAQVAVRKDYDLGFVLPGVPSPRGRLLTLPAGELSLPNGQVIEHPALTIGREDRIAVTGPNGAGKSTLIRFVLRAMDLAADRLVYLPQEVDLEESRTVLERFHALSPDEQGRVLTIVSALGSRPPRLLASKQASPGEVRKLLLATGAIREPHLVVMDEPTNHLDLPAVECLEAALDGCRSALLLVSHDRSFLAGLAATRWMLAPTARGSRLVIR